MISMKNSYVRRRLFRQRRFRHLLIGLAIMSFILGIAIVPVEVTHPDSNFNTWFDGLYWAVTTLTTVGYGDVVPVTGLGRLMSMVLQLVGATMFGITIAIISSYINRTQDEFYWNRLFERLNKMEQELSDLKKKSEFMLLDDHHPEADRNSQ